MRRELEEKINNAPQAPGCYFWKDVNNNIIYVGKAKNIKKRILQYFNKNIDVRKKKMVDNIFDLDYIIVNNENEALVLENNLIKTHKPKYNILLKENSNYPYIIVTNEKDPRIIYTRNYQKHKGKSYGPFPSNEINTYEVYNLLQRIIPFRKCNVVPKKKCIYYDMGQCLGPCINRINKEDYEEYKKRINDIFNGKIKNIVDELKKKELLSSENLDFESAKYYLELQNSLSSINQKQLVEFVKNIDLDIIGFYNDKNYISILIFNFFNGKLLSKHQYLSKYYIDEVNDMVTSYLVQYYSENKIPKKIYINLDDGNISLLKKYFECEVISSNKSKYKELIIMAINNAKKYLLDQKLKFENEYNRTQGAVEEIEKILNIKNITRIDMVDNSNIFNENPVSAFVSFTNGYKNTKNYRKINLDPKLNSDYHFMQYAIKKRYRNISSTNDIPDLLIVDGGKIQIKAAIESLAKLNIKTNIIGLKKNKNHKTESIVNTDGKEIIIDKKSGLYNFLSNIQEEVHRFAITHFREKRIKSQMNVLLDEIDGIGEKTKEKILSVYPNILSLKEIDIETLSQIVNKNIAKKIKDKIKEMKNENTNN